ncbi:hypothetical protein [Streptosporangium jomthongense]|uniref:FG-GAP repeat-containing protein n=1 Tax=Streptosporangium jomthongense TaxID=1193683 RepID=A0ABV8FDJ2_9ACTN
MRFLPQAAVPFALLFTLVAVPSSPSSPSSSPSPAGCGGDTAVGDPFASPGGVTGAGAVHVLSGRGDEARAVRAPAPAAGDGFGWSVRLADLDGDRCADLVVGAPYTDVAGRPDAGAVYIVYGTASRPPVRLLPSSPEAGAHFGWSLAVGRGTLAVGAPHEDADGVEDSGAVHLFDVGAGFGEGRRISQDTPGVPGSGEPGDMFGWSVAVGRMGGRRDAADLAVGAPYDNDDGTGRQESGGAADAGSIAVIYDVSGARDAYASRKWDLRRIVETHAGDRFGYSMAYAEEGEAGYLAVGAPLGDGGGVRDSGLVRLFHSSATEEITSLATLDQGSRGATGDGYGFSLALTGEGGARLAVGAPFGGPGGRGRVVVVPVRDPSAARVVERGKAGDRFGWAVGFGGNRLVVGAPDRDGSGAVTVLGRNDTVGTPLPPAQDDGEPAEFGASVG